jgi:glycosyltransferase involved in cell wall biosynthesis
MPMPVRKRKDKIAVIIPCKVEEEAGRCVYYCQRQIVPPAEIIVIPDSVCPGLPAEKRNYAMSKTKCDIFAFIDSDAYPPPDWIKNALLYLRSFPAVCGPGIIPPNSSPAEIASDLVYKHMPFAYRVTPKRARIVREFPTFNLLVHRRYAVPFQSYLTGEDSLFCRQLPAIFYHPSILVYHKRRPLFKPFLKQTGTYGYHRGLIITLAVIGWIGVGVIYPINFIKGVFNAHIISAKRLFTAKAERKKG